MLLYINLCIHLGLTYEIWFICGFVVLRIVGQIYLLFLTLLRSV
jgi:hypothetical protein